MADLEQQKARALATVHAVDGALQECEHWLAALEKAEEEALGREDLD